MFYLLRFLCPDRLQLETTGELDKDGVRTRAPARGRLIHKPGDISAGLTSKGLSCLSQLSRRRHGPPTIGGRGRGAAPSGEVPKGGFPFQNKMGNIGWPDDLRHKRTCLDCCRKTFVKHWWENQVLKGARDRYPSRIFWKRSLSGKTKSKKFESLTCVRAIPQFGLGYSSISTRIGSDRVNIGKLLATSSLKDPASLQRHGDVAGSLSCGSTMVQPYTQPAK